MKKQIPTTQTASNIQKVMQLLEETPGQLESLSYGLSDQQLLKPLASGDRSFTEALAHLINTEALSSEAIYLALIADEPLLNRVHAERDLGKLLRFDLLPFPELITYFRLRRTVLLRVLASLTEQQWSRCVREGGKQRKESVYWRTRSMALHEWEHVQDLELKLNRKSSK